ncbi:hypothetical protein [Streptosporangium sandarakinum]
MKALAILGFIAGVFGLLCGLTVTGASIYDLLSPRGNVSDWMYLLMGIAFTVGFTAFLLNTFHSSKETAGGDRG